MCKRIVRVSLVFLCLLTFCVKSHGQWALPWQMRGETVLDNLVNANGLAKADLLYGTLTASASASYSYIDQKWNTCSFLLFEGEKLVEGYLVKYDLQANTLAVKFRTGVRVIDVKKVKSIVWLDSLTHAPRYFVNAKDYKDENAQMSGLLEVLVDGQVPLLAQSYIVEKEVGFFATVLALFEKGEREKKYEVKKWYYASNGSTLSKISAQRELLLSFGDFYWEMEEYIQKNELDITMQSGLKKVFEHYNAKFERLPDY